MGHVAMGGRGSAAVPLTPRDQLPHAWAAELDAVRPGLVVHGHYHLAWHERVERAWGSCVAVGLAEDGSGFSNLAILECSDVPFSLHTAVPDR